MNFAEAENTIVSEMLEREGLIYKIAMADGIDNEAYERLKSALKVLTDHFKGSSTVPKRIARCFIDLSPLIERSIDRYDESEQEVIEDIRNEIVSMVEDLFS